MEFTHVQLKQIGSVGVLTLHHPPANALSQQTFKGLLEALHHVEQEPSIKVLVIHGEGKFFAAGADIKEFTSIEHAEQATSISKVGQDVFMRMDRFSKPIIAAIHGAALGGGLELAMACHIRFATYDAKLGLPESNLGILPGFGGTQRLMHIVGKAKALELMFTGQPITGEEAHKLGLVNRCHEAEQLLNKSISFAENVSDKSALSLNYVLKAVAQGEEHGFEAGSVKETELFGRIFESYDAKEGITAFVEKRKPNFQDK